MKRLLDRLEACGHLAEKDYLKLLNNWIEIDTDDLFDRARNRAQKTFDKHIYLRGLIEISSYCKNNCIYCGIRSANTNAVRYRLSPEEILECCAYGYNQSLRTFVLQGGEDGWFNDERLATLVLEIKRRWPEAAITLSLGERSKASYTKLRAAGADRYLLRHETADADHYRSLHPAPLSFDKRRRCHTEMKTLGYQVGAGFMVGSPGQTPETLAKDLIYLQTLQPEMVGIGPFVPHQETPFAGETAGSIPLTLVLIALVRLILPYALLPSTTALETMLKDGLEQGILAGANVIMPSLTPSAHRKHYLLYDNKKSTGAEHYNSIEKRMAAIGYQVVSDRGDAPHQAIT